MIGTVVVTPPQTVLLTTLAVVKGDLKLTTTNASRDQWLSDRIEDASRAIETELDRPLTRQRVKERFNGTGRMLAALELTPVVKLEKLTNAYLGDSDLLENDLGFESVRIENAEAGQIWRQNSFPDDSPKAVWLTVDSMAQTGTKPWEATYLGGWLTRDSDVLASGYDAAGAVLTAGSGVDRVMPLLAEGEQVNLVGWPSNRGRFLVIDRTDLTITVDRTLTTETAGAGARIDVRTLPATLERACLDTVRAWFYGLSQNPNVEAEHIGDWGVTFGNPGLSGSSSHVLPARVLMALDRFRRLM